MYQVYKLVLAGLNACLIVQYIGIKSIESIQIWSVNFAACFRSNLYCKERVFMFNFKHVGTCIVSALGLLIIAVFLCIRNMYTMVL